MRRANSELHCFQTGIHGENENAATDEFNDVVDGAYVIEAPDESDVAVPDSLGETAQGELGGGAVVTFTLEIADSYHSIRLLLPRDPLFEALVRETAPDEVEGLELICGSATGSGSEVTRQQRLKRAKHASVVQPAVVTGEERTLLVRIQSRSQEMLSRPS